MKACVHTGLVDSFICNSPKLEKPRCSSVGEWIDIVLYPYSRIQLSDKKQWTSGTCGNLNDSQNNYNESNKSNKRSLKKKKARKLLPITYTICKYKNTNFEIELSEQCPGLVMKQTSWVWQLQQIKLSFLKLMAPEYQSILYPFFLFQLWLMLLWGELDTVLLVTQFQLKLGLSRQWENR